MELTKKEFEQILDQKLNKLVTEQIFTQKLDKQTKVLSEQIEELARMTKNGFDDVLDRLDVKERVEKLEKDMMQMKLALHLS